MKDTHLTAERLVRLLAGDDEEQNWLLLHHLAVCPGCYSVGGHILRLFEAKAIGPDFCSLDLDLAVSREESPRLLGSLDGLPFASQKDRVGRDPAFHTVGCCEYLCAESARRTADDPVRAADLAELAVLVGSLLQEDQPIEEGWLDELRALAWAHRGNALRVLGELRGAEEAFRRAEEHWVAGEDLVGDALGYEARYLGLQASLRLAQGRTAEARALLDRAIAADEAGVWAASLRVQKARIVDELGEPEDAAALLADAAAKVDRAAQPQDFLAARLHLLELLSRRDPGAAAALLPEVRELARAHGGNLDGVDGVEGLRLDWVEARLAFARGEGDEALRRWRQVRSGLSARGLGYDAVRVSLEIACALLQLGRLAEVRPEAEEVVLLFAAGDVHHEALAAVVTFLSAVRRGEVTTELTAEVRDYLHRARQQPTLRFNGHGERPAPVS